MDEFAEELNLDDQEKIVFIQKYNKSNNRLFTKKGGKNYLIDEYRLSVIKYNDAL